VVRQLVLLQLPVHGLQLQALDLDLLLELLQPRLGVILRLPADTTKMQPRSKQGLSISNLDRSHWYSRDWERSAVCLHIAKKQPHSKHGLSVSSHSHWCSQDCELSSVSLHTTKKQPRSKQGLSASNLDHSHWCSRNWRILLCFPAQHKQIRL
jgi:hypothetical protein